jgi:diaminopropionate ammonia-lyase
MAGALSDHIYWCMNSNARKTASPKTATADFSGAVTRRVQKFHQTLPNFKPTPLAGLDNLAHYLGVVAIRVKDESFRCGLNAFKVLGASFALSSYLVPKLALDPEKVTFNLLKSDDFRALIQDLTCITATDGNHGRAVAWAARQLGCRAVVYMPKGSSVVRLENIRSLGADADIIDGNYDDAVRLAADRARENGWLLVQDTASPGYENIPIRVMQGYLTMFEEAFEQMGGVMPSHVFIQCGVGSLAGSLQAYLVEKFGPQRPLLTIVEPTRAACYYQSIIAGDGEPRKVEGDLDTIMAGLACGEPNRISWNILRDYADAFVACPDGVTIRGMRVLGNPLKGDDRVISGESGAVTLGLLVNILQQPDLRPLKQALNLQPDSNILLFSTEGDTDPTMYRKIVWGL